MTPEPESRPKRVGGERCLKRGQILWNEAKLDLCCNDKG